MPILTTKAYAKLNLSLEVLGKREDGFHEIRSILQTIDLWDMVSFEISDSIKIACDVPELNNQTNIAYKAVSRLKQLSQSEFGIDINIKKGIPIAGGLGGGSSDAAVSLRAANKLWELGLTQKQLALVAGDLGSDVPFFLHGGTCFASGKGEQVTPLPGISEQYIFLVNPEHKLSNKTPFLYENINPTHFSSGNAVTETALKISENGTLQEHTMVNPFESLAFHVFPGLVEYKNAMKQAGITRIHLSGTGPALFSIEPDWERMCGWRKILQGKGIIAQIVKPVSIHEEI